MVRLLRHICVTRPPWVNHSCWDKMAIVLHTAFSNLLPWKNIVVFWFHVSAKISCKWFSWYSATDWFRQLFATGQATSPPLNWRWPNFLHLCDILTWWVTKFLIRSILFSVASCHPLSWKQLCTVYPLHYTCSLCFVAFGYAINVILVWYTSTVWSYCTSFSDEAGGNWITLQSTINHW